MLGWLGVEPAYAGVSEWNLDANGNWGTAGNWNPSGVPNSVDAAVLFGSVITANRTITVNSSNRTIGSLEVNDDNNYTFNSNRLIFDVSAGNATLTVSGSGSPIFGTTGITLNDNLDISHTGTAVLTFQGTATLDLNGNNLLLAGSGDTVISRAVVGSGSQFLKATTGTITFSGNNTYSGGLVVRSGVVQGFNNNGAFGAGAITLGDSGTGGAEDLALLGIGTASRTYANNITVNNFGATVTIGGNTTTTGDITTFSGNITLNRDVIFQETNTANLAAMTIFTGGIDGAGGITKTGDGIVRLAGDNTFSGGVVLRSGTLQLAGNNNALGAGAVIIGDESTGGGQDLYLLGAGSTAQTYGNDITVGDFGNAVFLGGNTSGGTVTTFAGDLVFDREVNLYETNTNGSARTDFTGQITTEDDLVKSGGGRVRIDSALNDSSMTGNITVSLGTLIIAGGGAVGDSTQITVNASTILNFAASETIGSVTGAGNVTLDNGAVLTTGNDNLTTTLSGRLQGGDATSGLTKVGTGTFTLVFSNTYNGTTTIEEGVLRIEHNNALGGTASGTIVNSGATLALAGGLATLTGENLTLNGSGVAGMAALYGAADDNSWRGPTLLASASTIGSAVGTTLNITSVISGAGDLIATGPGSVRLSGVSNYTGATILRHGSLLVNANAPAGADGNLGNSTSAVELGDSGTGGSDVLAFLMADNNGASTVARDINVNDFGDTITVGGLNVSGTNTFSGVLTLNRDVILSTNGGTVNYTGNVTGAGDMTKQGDGTWQFSSANNDSNMTGNFTLQTGTLSVTGGGALGDATALTLDSGTNFAVLASETVGSVGGAGNITLSNGQVLTMGGNDLSTTLSGVIGGGNGTSGLVKSGAGTLTLNGTNTFTGTVVVQEGVLSAQSNAALGTSAGGVTVQDGAQLELRGGVTITGESLNLNGGGGGTGALLSAAGSNTWTGNLSLQADATVGAAGGATLTLSGNLNGDAAGRNLTFQGAGGFTASGSLGANIANVTLDGGGTLTLSGAAANAFTGVFTIESGTVNLAKTGGAAAVSGSQILISSGGTLLSAGNNQIADATNMVLDGGHWLAQGNSETLGTLTLTENSLLDLGGGASIIQFADSSGAAWTGGATLYVMNWDGDFAGGGTNQIYFGNNGSGLTGGPHGTGQIDQIIFLNPGGDAGVYNAQILSTGEVVPFQPVPEPSTYAAGAALALLAGAWEIRRRKRRASSAPDSDAAAGS